MGKIKLHADRLIRGAPPPTEMSNKELAMLQGTGKVELVIKTRPFNPIHPSNRQLTGSHKLPPQAPSIARDLL